MRNDALGFFWEDKPVEKVKKEAAPKKTPPPPTWEDPSYLPHLAEAIAFNVPQLTIEDLVTAPANEEYIWDVETYRNFYCCAFESLLTGKVMTFELSPWCPQLDIQLLRWIIENRCIVGFNSISYDATITALALAGCSNEILKWASDELIINDARPQDILRRFKVKKLVSNHIDLLEVAPLRANLKIYGGRLHAPRMQDLPFSPHVDLSWEQSRIVKYYNINDLSNTRILRKGLTPQIDLRYIMSNEYRVDLRSKSDAQIAETVIASELENIQGVRARQPEIEPGTWYSYNVPHYMEFQTPLMQHVLNVVRNTQFIVADHGAVVMPEALSKLEIKINAGTYTMGIGGLHSTESKVTHRSGKHSTLRDRDVTSYYPMIILNQRLFPAHLGPDFLTVYRGLVERRIAAKDAGDKNTAESLKIVVNGSYGKLGSKYSVLYAPDLLIQVTITGQLTLLMLIEAMEICGITVVSANTDGVTMSVPTHLESTYEQIVKWWEGITNFTTEETVYTMLASRDVNNYIAIKAPNKEGKIESKTKGAFANPWSDPKKIEPRMHKNPTNQICIEAIENLFIHSIPIRDTIYKCKDITKFVSIRTVKGGAVMVTSSTFDEKATLEQKMTTLAPFAIQEVEPGKWVFSSEIEEVPGTSLDNLYKRACLPDRFDYLGKSIRWYYSNDRHGEEMVYALSGKKVPRSDGAKPCMDLPDQFPTDINYDWYIAETESMLSGIGYL